MPHWASQLDLSDGLEAAVPGWADVRLLAPHSELRLLVCGQGSLIDAHRLRYVPMILPQPYRPKPCPIPRAPKHTPPRPSRTAGGACAVEEPKALSPGP